MSRQDAVPVSPGPCMSCGVQTVTNVPGYWLCQSCAELGFTVPVEGPEVSQAVSQGPDIGIMGAASPQRRGSSGPGKDKHQSHPLPRKHAAKAARSHCTSCQATQRINRYDPNGKVCSIITTHQPACPALLARRQAPHHD